MPDSSGATVFDDLPEWLVVDEILVRLPPKDILRCRAVRKSWRSGTSTDKFILDHHHRQPSLPIITHHEKGICRLSGAGASSDEKIQHILSIRYGRGTIIPVFFHAAYDGLLILQRQEDFYICNPATRRCASLPYPPLRLRNCGMDVVAFYRHHTSGELRVLWASYSIPDRSDDSVELPDYFVLAVGSDQPRRIQWPTVPDHGFPATRSSECPPVHHRGSLHWALGLNITAFDTVAETFRQMSRPAQLGNVAENWLSLLDMDGALALCSTGRGRVTLDVWVLQDYDAQTWGLQCQINLLAPPLDFFPSMAVINDRELLIQRCGDPLLRWDIDGVFLGNVESDEHYSCLSLTNHRLQESMISLPLFEAQEEDAVNKKPPFGMVM
ncbi:unnamed protein product [Alopecurus aequalis]